MGWACGVCDEDDRSAVYNHEAMEKVRTNPDRLEFVVLKVQGSLRQDLPTTLETWLKKQEGVDPSTIKISVPQKSIGFVLDKKYSKEKLAVNLKKAFPQLSFHIHDYETHSHTSGTHQH